MSDDQPIRPEPDTCPGCAALKARLRTNATRREVREARTIETLHEQNERVRREWREEGGT